MAMFPKLLLERDVLFLVLTGFVCEGYLKVLKNVKRDIVATELVGGPSAILLGRFFRIASQLHYDAQCHLMKVGYGVNSLDPSKRLINDVVKYWSEPQQ